MSQHPTNMSEVSNSATAPNTLASVKNQLPRPCTESSGDKNNHKMILDRQKAKDMLVHRKMLLERMQLCRKATNARLNLYANESNESKDANGISAGGEILISSRKRKFTSKQLEIQTYADLSKFAMNFTIKKAPVIKAPAPAPRNISLRTGSTVGNKMKAAVATLTTNVGWISDTSSSSTAQLADRKLAVSPMAPVSSNSQTIVKKLPLPEKTKLAHKPIPPNNGIQSASTPPILDNVKSMTIPAPKNNVKKLSSGLLSTGKQLKKKSTQSGKKRAGKAIRSGSSMSTSDTAVVANKPLHMMGPKGVISNGRDYNNYPSRVICPETERLRRKRRELVLKLDNLVRTRYEDPVRKEEYNNESHKRLYYDDNPYSIGKMPSWKSFMDAESQPCFLPEKRKTQWDYVLEEMRWLATDFVEESKWKRANAKTLSAAVIARHRDITTRAKFSPLKQPIYASSTDNLIEAKVVNKDADISEDNDDIMEEDSDSVSLIEEHVSDLEFVDPTEDDRESTKMISKAINSLVESHWNATSINDSENIAAAYNRYLEKRHREKKLMKTVVDENTTGDPPSHKQLSFEEIESRIEEWNEKIKGIKAGLAEDFDSFCTNISSSLEDTDLEIQENQLEMLQFTEALWKEGNHPSITGSVISGPMGSGKTFLTGLLLWRRRGMGPQLLLCPGASLIRWRHELSIFHGLNLYNIGAEFGMEKEEFGSKPGDIILCDFSWLTSLLSDGDMPHVHFTTVAVDARCASFPSSSFYLHDFVEKSRKRKIGAVQGKESSFGQMVGKELYSTEWWNCVIEHLKPNTKCALLETSGIVEGHSYVEDNEIPLPGTKERTDIFSSKVAFLYHQLFQSSRKTYCRRAFWWAKKHNNALKKGTSLANKSGVDLSNGVKGVLLQLLQTISFLTEVSYDEADGNVMSNMPKWAVQTCTLSPSQRDAYERACLFVRGAFQSAPEYSGKCVAKNTHISSAKALLHLRRSCFYSDLHELVSSPNEGLQKRLASSSRTSESLNGSDSSSQPDISFAKFLLEKSSKLRQLLHILCKDCGFDVPAKNFLFDTKPTRRGRKSSGGKRKKVLILATLPEVLLLLSSFLNAIGIAHELSTVPRSVAGMKQNSIEGTPSSSNVLSWIHWQRSINRFQESVSDTDAINSSMSMNVLVSSPNALASTSLGLSASNAEVVISVDEDWSGRCDLFMYSILRKNRTNNMQKVSGRKYIKVIAEDTCEQSFLTFEKKTRGKKSLQTVPLKIKPLQSSMLDLQGGIFQRSRSFLCQNILRYAGMPLHDVFFTDDMPVGALVGVTPLFLTPNRVQPGQCEENEVDERSETGGYDKVALTFDGSNDELEFINKAGGLATAVSFGLSLSKIERASVRPQVVCSPCTTVHGSSRQNDFKKYPASVIFFHSTWFKEIQRYVAAIKVQLAQLEMVESKNIDAPKQIIESKNEKEQIKVKTKDSSNGCGCKPPTAQVVAAQPKTKMISSSLIWYNCNILEENKRVLQNREDSKSYRENSYVRSYISIHRTFDGNQGCESLVYFPPLFPGLIQTKDHSEIVFNGLGQSFLNKEFSHIVPYPAASKKRKNSSDDNGANSKKLRTPIPQNILPIDFSMGVQSADTSQPFANSSILTKDISTDLMAVPDVDFMDSATDLFDGDFLPDLNITKDEEVVDEAQSTEVMEVEDTTKPSLDEDFGILGSGLLPSLEESTKAAMKYNGYSNSYSYWLDPFELPLSSNEEFPPNAPGIDSIILRVRRSAKHTAGATHRSVNSLPLSTSVPAGSMARIFSSNGGFDPSQIGSQFPLQKKKKKSGVNEKRLSIGPASSLMPVSSFEPMISSSHPPMPHVSGFTKDPKARSQLEMSSVFDSFVHYGVPLIKVHHQLQSLLDPARKQIVSRGLMSPNSQNSLVSSQNSIRQLLPDENTGDAAKKLSEEQLSSFCRDSLVSFGVYFGPFSTSILPDASIKERMTIVDIRVGIKLPMGVKVPKSIGTLNKNIDAWSKAEDSLLAIYGPRFDFNWHAVSHALTNKSRTSACLDTVTTVNPIRSAKECEQRWNAIKAGGKLEDISEITKSERGKGDILHDAKLTPDSSLDILLDNRHFSNANKMVTHGTQSAGEANRAHSIKRASTKRHVVPLTIPGYASGANMPPLQIVPSHHSHSQSVQAAIAASGRPSGIMPPRAEMWPLQFLDLTEKQHQELEKKKQKLSASQGSQQQVIPVRSSHPQRQNNAINQGVSRTGHVPTSEQFKRR